MTYNEQIFTKLASDQQRRVQNFYTKFHPYPTNNAESRVKNYLTSLNKILFV
jgi:hypothetical protein